MAKPLKPFVRGGGYYPSSRWTPLVYPGGYTTANGNGAEPTPLIKTVKGAITHVTDALAIPAIGLKCEINPLQAGTGDPSPDNVRPITGWTGCNVTRTGKNLFDIPSGTLKVGTINKDTGVIDTSASTSRYTENMLKIKGGANYAFQCVFSSSPQAALYMAYYDSNGAFLERVVLIRAVQAVKGAWSGVVQMRDDASYIRLCGYVGVFYYSSNRQIEEGNEITDYEPYQGNTYSITFPAEAGTVYGGTLDVMNGTLMVTEANIANYDGETLPGEWVSDRDVYSAGATPTTGAQVVYKLSNPIAYQLTPQQIELLAGVNNIWHDANGDTELTYYAE